MRNLCPAVTALAFLVLQGCSTEVSKTNPMDPESISPARGKLRGQIEAPTLSSPAGVRVRLFEGPAEVSPAITDADGRFLFTNLPHGRYNLEIAEEGFQRVVIYRLEVEQGGVLDLGLLTLVPLSETEDASELHGSVHLEGMDFHGGVQVRTIGRPFETFSSADGSWQLIVSAGTYDLELAHADFQTHVMRDVQVGEGEQHVMEHVDLEADPATIIGTVLARTCAPDPSDEVELPAEDALVTALGTGQTGLADDTGAFSVTGLPAGVYTLRAVLDGHEPDRVAGLSVRGGDVLEVSESLVLYASKGAISGRVLASGEADHSGTIVQISGTGFAAFTDSEGHFRIGEVCAGEGYQLTATRPGFVRSTQGGLNVLPNETTELETDLVLERQQGDFVLNGGEAFTNAQEISYVLTAPAGSVEMRLGEDDALFHDPDRAEEGWQPYERDGTFALSSGEGTKRVHAQVRGAGAASAVLDSLVILDLTPPADPTVVIGDGGPFSNSPSGSLVLTLTATEIPGQGVDQVSGLSNLKLLNHDLESGDEPPQSPDNPLWDDAPELVYTRTLNHYPDEPLDDGEKEIWVRFGDAAGNWSDPVSARVVLDRMEPQETSIAIQGSAPGWANSGIVTLSLNATDEHPGISMRVSNDSTFTGASWIPYSPSLTWFLTPEDGPKEVWAQFRDAAGNMSSPLSDTITLDTQPPSSPRMSIDEAPYSSQRDVTLSLSAHGANEMVFSLEPDFTDEHGEAESWIPFSSSHVLSLPDADGHHTVYGKLRDQALNETVRLSAEIVLDRVPPTVQSVSIAEGRFVSSPTVTVLSNAIAGERHAHEMRIDLVDVATSQRTMGIFGPFNPSQTIGLAQGEIQVEVFVRDAAGNVSDDPGVALVTYDPDPPLVAGADVVLTGLDKHGESTTLTRVPNVSVELQGFPDSESADPDPSGLPYMRVAENAAFAGASWRPYARSFNWLFSGDDGDKTLYVQVRDGAGNVSDAVDGTITLDQTPPRPATILISDGAEYSTDRSVTLSFWVGGQAVDWSLDGGETWEPCIGGLCAQSAPGESHSHSLAAGDGVKQVQVVFRDDAGNISEVFSDEIILKESPPDIADASLDLISPTSNGFTNSVSIDVALEFPPDATHMQVAAAGGVDCAASDMDGVTAQPATNTFTFLLPSGNGHKKVCARFIDAAGNVSSFLSDTIILDTIPPTSPQIVTPHQVVSRPDGSSFTVETAAPVSDDHFSHYEKLGGKTESWTLASTHIETTSFTFNLKGSAAVNSGLPNLLRLRAVDEAGNTSPEATVLITNDVVPPGPVTMNSLWVKNADGKATVHWHPSNCPDVVAHHIYYGTASGVYTGLHANEGPSPILVGDQTSAVLSGLTNEYPTFVTVRPVDHAGQESILPPWGDDEVVLRPNETPINPIHRLDLSKNYDITRIGHLAHHEDVVFVLGHSACSGPSGNQLASTHLFALDTSRLVSPIHGGVIDDSAPGPELTWHAELPAELHCNDWDYFNDSYGMVVDGHRLFVASGNMLRIFDITRPSSPSLLADVDFHPSLLQALEVRGSTAFLAAADPTKDPLWRGEVIALDLSKLQDQVPGTFPNLADEIGRLGHHPHYATEWTAGIMWSRNRLVVNAFDYGYLRAYDTDTVFPGGSFDNSNYLSREMFGNSWGNPPQSGSYAYLTDGTALHVVDLNNLWSGSSIDRGTHTVASGGTGAHGTFQVAGGQAFIPDNAQGGFRGYDLSSLPAINTFSYYPASQSALSTLLAGNYLFTRGDGATLTAFETGTPRMATHFTQTADSHHLHRIEGAFAYLSDGSVIDLQGGLPPPNLGPSLNISQESSINCSRDLVTFDDGSILAAADGKLRVYHHEKTLDRSPLTEVQEGSDYYDVEFPDGTEATGLAMYGNYLLVAQRRADGIWLEAFDATPLRDRDPGTILDDSGSLGELRVSERGPPADGADARWITLTLHRGLALLGLDDGPHFYDGFIIVDARPMFDNDPNTFSTDEHILRGLKINRVREISAIGHYAYAATAAGIRTIDISNALDDSTTDPVPFPPAALGSGYDSVAVHGSYLVTAGWASRVYDISEPSSPMMIGSFHSPGFTTSCIFQPEGGADTEFIPRRSSVTVLGSRAYITDSSGLAIYDLR